jgi:hypothetical protein
MEMPEAVVDLPGALCRAEAGIEADDAIGVRRAAWPASAIMGNKVDMASRINR